MSYWEQKILEAFTNRYYKIPRGENRHFLRLKTSTFFPEFLSAPVEEKLAYLEAAEALAERGVITLTWEKHERKEKIKTITCQNTELLFKELGKAFPKAEAENIRALLAEKMATNSNVYPDLFQHLYHNFDSHDIGRGINYEVMVDFLGFLDLFSEPAKIGKMTPRSISILLYRDSKRLEQVLSLCGHLIPEEFEVDLSPLLRSYPETYLSGKFRFAYKNKDEPMINPYGHAIGMYYKHIEAIQEISLVTIKLNPRVLSIENKETYFALASRANFDEEDKLSQFDCFLYTGGYPNRAVTSLIKILASSGFSLYHAGDLDPDGILILQRIQEIAGKEVIPHRMDRETFDTYSTWAKPLPATVLSQLKKINKETTAIPGIQGLINKIEESGTGVEQEIIDYR